MRPRAELAGAIGLSATQWHWGVGAAVRPWWGVRRFISEFSAPRQGGHGFRIDEQLWSTRRARYSRVQLGGKLAVDVLDSPYFGGM
jgi:hypothetical protein